MRCTRSTKRPEVNINAFTGRGYCERLGYIKGLSSFQLMVELKLILKFKIIVFNRLNRFQGPR